MLKGKHILLGITGSIAAYKTPDIARRLIEHGASIQTVMTEAASKFIPPYTLEAITGNRAHIDLFKDPFSHIELSKKADLFLIVPATANTINKISCGIADNLLSNLMLTYEGPVVCAPAMNCRMYRNPLVQKNIKKLKKRGVTFVGPEKGNLACGDEGEGRLSETGVIVEAVVRALSGKDLQGETILVTAGPTRESIDAVRYISNRSSGKMGYAIALAAIRRGAEVTLISGPSSEEPPDGVHFQSVETAAEMEKAVLTHMKKSSALIMAAAVSDIASAKPAKGKLKKNEIVELKLKKTADILKKAGEQKKKVILIGFAAESGKDIRSAKEKLKKKNLDLIVLNDITKKGSGFDVDTNEITIIDTKGKISEYPFMQKIEAADIILDRILNR